MDASGAVQPASRPKKRTGTSKYDFIKVKVWLGDNMDHYYILSRFLICRMLTVTRIPYIKAVKVALETKKFLVDNNLHDVTQAQLEEVLFSIVRSKGFDEAHIDCYRMVTQFYQSRQPLCIIICGAAWTGKSSLAQQLASRINIPNVMQTDVIYELLRAGPDSPLHPVPLWARPGLSGSRCCDAALVREFRREARVVREGMEGDLIKTLSDGKPIIIEGCHLDPGLYIPDFASRGIIMLPSRPNAAVAAAAAAAAAGGGLHAAAAAGRSPGSSPLAGRSRYGRSQTVPPRGAAALAAAAAAATATDGVTAADEPLGAADQLAVGGWQQQAARQWEQQQQQSLLWVCDRSASARAEISVSADGLSQGSLVHPGRPFSAGATPRAMHTPAASSAAEQLAASTSQQQQQPHRLFTVSTGAEGCAGQQVVASLPPLPPLRVQQQRQLQEQDCSTESFSEANNNSSTMACSTSLHSSCHPVQQQHVQQQGTPFADTLVADAVVQAAAAAGAKLVSSASPPHAAAATGATPAAGLDSLYSSLEQLPVVMLNQVQVCAAAAEAAALQQHHQELLQQQEQQQRSQQAGPGSPFSSASDVSSLGVGGASPPSISQEHSTTEVVSRVCSCASLGSPAQPLSQEPSGGEVWSPAAAAARLAPAPAAGPAGPAATGGAAGGAATGCGAAVCRRLGSGPLRSSRQLGAAGVGGVLVVRRSPRASLRQLQEETQQVEGLGQQQQQHQVLRSDAGGYQEPAGGITHPGSTSTAAESPGAATAPVQHTGSSALPEQEPDRGHEACRLPSLQDQPAALVLGSAPAAVAVRVGSAAAAGSTLNGRASQPASYSDQQVLTGASTAGLLPEHSAPQQLQEKQQQQRRAEEDEQQQPAIVIPDVPSKSNTTSKGPGSESVGKPLFVPILVYMDEADHALMADEACAHLGGMSPGEGTDALISGGGDGDGGSAVAGSSWQQSNGLAGAQDDMGHDVGSAEALQQQQQQECEGGVCVAEALRRVRLLQEYLCAYEAQGLPVVKVSYGAFGEALDKLHEYILQCIKVAMSSRQSAV